MVHASEKIIQVKANCHHGFVGFDGIRLPDRGLEICIPLEPVETRDV